jgi:hypothetical protein
MEVMLTGVISETTSEAQAKTRLDSRQGFAYASSTKPEPLQVRTISIAWFGVDGRSGGHPRGRSATTHSVYLLSNIGYSCKLT